MMVWRAGAVIACGAFVSVLLFLGGAAGAQSAAEDQYSHVHQEAGIPALRQELQAQGSLLEQGADRISSIGAQIEEAQGRSAAAQEQVAEIQQQTRRLESEHAGYQRSFANSQELYEDRVRAAYKGGELDGLSSLLQSLFGSGDGPGAVADARTAQILFSGRESLEEYQESRQYVSNTMWQLNESRSAHRKAREEEQARAEELRRRKAELDEAIARIQSDHERTQTRLQELRQEEKDRIQRQSPASGGMEEMQAPRERRIARDIVARSVSPISTRAYERLYKKAAKEYGFAGDWYILAAVGKVESNHGQNMGPSSAGALGPMQFLPSTWEVSGVDGNGDGVANIMDPRDAIPAAARYLEDGGAPEDWYAALYSYNHAGWYVREVLAVAESYRQIARDNRVGPYTQIQSAS